MAKIWTAYIKRKDKDYFICYGKSTIIMGRANRRLADLGLDNVTNEIEYRPGNEIEFEAGYVEELAYERVKA